MMTTTMLLASLCGLVTASAYLLTAIRLITFARNGARHRPWISALATSLIAATLTKAVLILLYHPVVDPTDALISTLLCCMVVRARGNLAALLRTDA